VPARGSTSLAIDQPGSGYTLHASSGGSLADIDSNPFNIMPRPVAAAGGISDARGVVAVLALGAQAAVLGTRFLASTESHAHPRYKERLLAATEEDTVRTILFGHGWPNAPHRTLRTAFVQQWLGQEARAQQSRPDEPVVGQTVLGGQPVPVLRFVSLPPNVDARGEIDSMSLLAGQGVGLVREVEPAGQIVHDLVKEARQIIARHLAGLGATETGRGEVHLASDRGGSQDSGVRSLTGRCGG
jgi:NAD(P)H-dependent flavin oxidoreductase YrpB (nitropropane dioxygenase family)